MLSLIKLNGDVHMKKCITINSKNLLFNYDYYKKKTNKKIIAVIKDNAYGHGYKQIIKILENSDALMYAVSNINEASLVSKHTKKDILILDRCTDYKKISNQMILTIINENHIQELIETKLNFRVHLKINTGMNRKGINSNNFSKCLSIILNSKNLHLEGIYTHYASNKIKELKKQFKLFENTCKYIDKSKYLIHASSSNSSILLKEDFTNACRIGIGLFGLCDSSSALKPVLSFYSYVDSCSPINKNCKIGYDYAFKTHSKGYLILSPVGYSNGYTRGKKYYAFYKNNYIKQISNVCMDCCIYFSKTPIKINDKIELFGENIRINNIAKKSKKSPYEIITLLSKDIKRIVI